MGSVEWQHSWLFFHSNSWIVTLRLFHGEHTELYHLLPFLGKPGSTSLKTELEPWTYSGSEKQGITGTSNTSTQGKGDRLLAVIFNLYWSYCRCWPQPFVFPLVNKAKGQHEWDSSHFSSLTSQIITIIDEFLVATDGNFHMPKRKRKRKFKWNNNKIRLNKHCQPPWICGCSWFCFLIQEIQHIPCLY